MGVEYATQKELGNLLQQATRWLPPLGSGRGKGIAYRA